MISHFRLMFADMQGGIDAEADHERDILTLELPGETKEFSLSYARSVLCRPYDIHKPENGWKEEFSEAEKAKLRPIAETLAMLDGNAFFTMQGSKGREWYESYLPAAHALWEANGGDSGWAGESSIGKSHRPLDENRPAAKPTVAAVTTEHLKGGRVQSQRTGNLGTVEDVTLDRFYASASGSGASDAKDHAWVKILWDHGGSSHQRQSELEAVDFLG